LKGMDGGGLNLASLRRDRLPDGCLAQEEIDMRDKSKGVDGKKRRKKKPPELKEPKKRDR
jgi:hypothetical protein